MRPLRVSENIVPVSEFKTRTAEWLRRLGEESEPIVITQNGRAAGVLLSPEAYDRLVRHIDFVAAVEEGLAQSEAGPVSGHEEVAARARRRHRRSRKR
ncbi:MAG: type II toxin-antitoxin system Phd/YefM family antitoxin [Deltaproteobacteria bacterium]|nr:type II toxin-antitoxin system Phd/YefM family antitoxin [Deltaproteobacteria bacterium]